MILTVTPNLALDVTYRLPVARADQANRVTAVTRRAGGKGVNVARVLATLGHAVRVLGCAGGPAGTAIRADLAAAGLPDATVTIAGESRSTLVVAESDAGRATGYWEPGPEISDDEWSALAAAVERELAGAAAIVLSGSLPPGAPADGYAQLIALAHAARVPSVLDADGPALEHGIAAGPALVKPNREELARAAAGADALRRAGAADVDPLAAARALAERAGGRTAVVVSLGAEGLLAVTPDGTWRAALETPLSGNATGAGDAAVAALTRGLVDRTPWPERLRDAVALSAAAVRHPVAGGFDRAAYEALHPHVRVHDAAEALR